MSRSAPRVRYTDRILYTAWAPRPRKAAREVYGKFRHHKTLTLHSYDNHGHPGAYRGDLARGDSTGIDFYVCGYNGYPTKAQIQLGWAITNYATKNWRRLGVLNLIFNGKINTFDGRGWRKYDPTVYKKWYDANWPTKIHDNHLHMQVRR